MRELLTTFIHSLICAEWTPCAAPDTATAPTSAMDIGTAISTPAQVLWISRSPSYVNFPTSPTGYWNAENRPSDPDHRGCHLLPTRSLHAADGQARRDLGHHQSVQVAGVGDGLHQALTAINPHAGPCRGMGLLLTC
jgi:hypothetical protein